MDLQLTNQIAVTVYLLQLYSNDSGGCGYLCLASGEMTRVCAYPDNLPDCSDSQVGKNNTIPITVFLLEI